MSVTYELDGGLFYEMVRAGAVNLRNNVRTVNELNVFPIPDGDTGENMARTIEGGVCSAAPAKRVCDVADGLAKGMLMSARGNSGVILSQFFEGFKRGVAGMDKLDVSSLKCALSSGVKQAYAAVVRPTEGTILTVMREAGEKADAGDAGSLEEFFESYIDELYSSLERTPELLPVLKDAGVIDSGGAGFAYIVEGMNRALNGMQIENTGAGGAETAATADQAAAFDENSVMDYGYCTELIVQLLRSKTDVEDYDVKTLVSYLESIGGDSVVAFKTGTRIKLHVHTFEPDKVIAYCLTIGELVAVKVENMSIQHTETVVRNRFERQSKKLGKDDKKNKARKKYACITVADGDGLIEQFRSLGADYVVAGKQTGNPSTQDFLTAFDEVNADNIFVLPNNANIVMAAEQAAGMYDKSSVRVVKTKSIAEGYSAMSLLDYSCDDADEIASMLEQAASDVITGLVTYSIRDCECCGRKVKKGEYLGLSDKTLVSSSDDAVECACALLYGVDKTDKSVVIAIRGKNATAAQTEKIKEYLKQTSPELEFYEFEGGQDVYSYIFVIE